MFCFMELLSLVQTYAWLLQVVQDLEPCKYELQMAEQKAFVLSVWSKVGGKQDVCSRYWQNAVHHH